MPHKIFSFFTGAGFLDLGFEDAGFDIVFASDLNPAFRRCYEYARHGKLPQYNYLSGEMGDINNLARSGAFSLLVKEAKDEGIVGFIGGPPCPDFSVAGKQRGREGDNGKLSGEYIDLICKQQPDFFLFENVRGLWVTQKHRAYYEALKIQLEEAGYRLFDRLINAIEYGVPQDRDRIILIGFRSNVAEFPWATGTMCVKAEAMACEWPTVEPFKENLIRHCPDPVPPELTVQYWFERNDVAHHPNALQRFTPRAGLSRFQSVPEGDTSGKSFKRLHRWRYAPTMCFGNNEVHLHPWEARRISIAEALALQSMPKAFCLPPDVSLSALFKTIGNGVPYLAAKGIASAIANAG